MYEGAEYDEGEGLEGIEYDGEGRDQLLDGLELLPLPKLPNPPPLFASLLEINAIATQIAIIADKFLMIPICLCHVNLKF